MKRRAFFLILAVLLCVTAAALADLTFNQACTKKTSRSTMLYVEINGELVETSTLPAGTYVVPNGTSLGGKTGITYSANNYDPYYGYIDGSVIVSAAQTVTLSNGRSVTVGEALLRSRAALNQYLMAEFGETLEGSGTYTDENGETHEIGTEAAADGNPDDALAGDLVYFDAIMKAGFTNGWNTPTTYLQEDGNETKAEVVYMGLGRSRVIMDGKEQMVDSWRLTWDSDAPEDKLLAVVTPPGDKGDIRFWAGPGTNTKIMHKVKTNRVLRVIRAGKNWTLVDIDDKEVPRGYISTQYLTFYPNKPMAYWSAKVSVAGYTKGDDPVWIRSKNKDNSAHIAKFDLGTPVSVYAIHENKWAEVDVGGYHAYILSKFVKMDEPAAEASAQAE